MNLYEQWRNHAENPSNEDTFMETYYERETLAYKKILSEKTFILDGTYEELMKELGMDAVTFMVFLDGIRSSLKVELAIEALDESSTVHLEIMPETLFYNMLAVKADWLFGLEEWDELLSEEERSDIRIRYNTDSRAISNKVGRNDPCPCGSGKKYKKCCGAA